MRAQIEKNRDLGKYVRASSRAVHPIACNRGKEPIILDDVNTLKNDELSLGSSPSLSLSPTKNARKSSKAKSRRRPTHHPTFNDAINGASHKVRREAGRRQNQPVQAPGNSSLLPEGTMPPVLLAGMMPPMPFVHLAFGTGSTFYTPSAALIRRPDDMSSSSLRQHILDYESPCGFVIPAFTMFYGYADPYNHMLHYNQAMILNVGNDRLLCKVFLASLLGPALPWFHKPLCNSINSFNELWATFIVSLFGVTKDEH